MYPSSLTLGLAVVYFIAGIAVAVLRITYPHVSASADTAMLLIGIALVAMAVLDAALVFFKSPLKFTRTVPGSFSVGTITPIRIRVDNSEQRAITIEVFDHTPAPMRVEHMPQRVRIPATQSMELHYTVEALERGLQIFPAMAYRRRSHLRLWWKQQIQPIESHVRVYPNFQAIAHYTLMARDNRLKELGIHKTQRRGQGKDFHQLRDYRMGDALKQIDWKATSRLQRAITREYQDERDQQVVFVLDHGRRMHSRDGKLSHLDHALNAMLLLSYVALRQGDAVGFLTFGRSNRFISPRKGPGHVNTILNAIYDLQSNNESIDPIAAAEAVLGRIKKRSLVILITNLGDDDHSDMIEMVRSLRTRHLVLLASLRERILADTLERLPGTFNEALTTTSIHHYLAYRKVSHAYLNKAGAMSFDVEPHKLPGHLVNRYLHIKASGAL